jgi:TRAP-type C4-dicarboxylate transport system permease small subunit
MGDKTQDVNNKKDRDSSVPSKFDHVVDKFFYFFLAYILLILVGVVAFQVIARTINITNSWTEEMARWAFVWSTFLGSAYFVYKKDLIIVDIIKEIKILSRISSFCEIPLSILSLCFYAVIAYGGIKYVMHYGGERAVAFGQPVRILYLSCPIAFSLMVIFQSINILKYLILKFKRKGRAVYW